MTSEWEDSTLGDVLTLQRGMDLPVQERKGGKHPIVASTGVVGFHNEAPVKAPGVVIGRSGSIGGGQFIDQDFWPLNTTLWVKDFKGNDPRYCYYLLKSIDFSSMNAGSGVPTLNRNHLHPMRVAKPPVSVQKSISGMLGCLDDRITLLHETNATLEAIAQALFKSWFVDFDPVRAKADGKLPDGVDAATAALFPDVFEESELGLVPSGWKVSPIYEVAAVTYGAPFASKLFKANPPGLPLVRIRDLKDERPGVYTEEVHPKGYLIQSGDIVVGMDGEFRAYVWGGEEAWLNQRVCVFAPVNGACAAFVRLSITPLLAAVEASETATTVIHLGKNDIDRFKIICPTPKILKSFGEIVNPIYSRFVKNKQQIQTLSNLRDTLLPRLISGRLRIADAEAELEKAMA